MGEFCVEHEEHTAHPTLSETDWPSRGSEKRPAVPPYRPGDRLFELWLDSCEGFRATRGDLTGTIVCITRDAEDQPRRLIVRAGLFRRTEHEIRVEDIEAIAPESKLVYVRREPEGRGGAAVAEARDYAR